MLFCLVPDAGRAQQHDSLTLAEAIGVGLEYNYDVRVGALQTRTAEINNTWGPRDSIRRWPWVRVRTTTGSIPRTRGVRIT